jgi:hypothetical protein
LHGPGQIALPVCQNAMQAMNLEFLTLNQPIYLARVPKCYASNAFLAQPAWARGRGGVW